MVDLSKLLSNEFFEPPLRNYFGNDKLKVLKCESVSAIPVGENYTSDIFRTTVTYTKETRFVVELLIYYFTFIFVIFSLLLFILVILPLLYSFC